MLLLLLLAAIAPAQGRTWIVDASNGPGTHFTDLPPAVAAAADGDVLVVRAGQYAGFRTSKALRVLGASGATVVAAPGQPALEVNGLPAGRTFALNGVTLVPSPSPLLALRGSPGRIHLEAVRHGGFAFASVIVESCPEVTIHGWLAGGAARFELTRSSVVLARTALAGWPTNGPLPAGSPPIVATLSSLWLTDCVLTGGASTGPLPPTAGLQAATCGVRLDGASSVAAGTTTPSLPLPVPAILAPASAIAIDPAVVLTPHHNAPPISGASLVATQRFAALAAPPASLGGMLAPSLRSGPGDAYALVLGLPADSVLTSIGVLFVDLANAVVAGQGVQGASGVTTFAFAVPNDPALRGATFALQAANAYLGERRLGMTNPRMVTLD
jgi:hypothetical protein